MQFEVKVGHDQGYGLFNHSLPITVHPQDIGNYFKQFLGFYYYPFILKETNAMKYAFILGTNAFIVPSGVISYADSDNLKQLLHIRSIWHDTEPQSFLSVDLDIKDTGGKPIQLQGNQGNGGTDFRVMEERKSVSVLAMDGSVIIKIQQLDDDAAMSLEHNITAELEVNTPIVVIRIFGDFMAQDIHVIAENEKLYVNNDEYATSALAGKELRFTPDGVVL